MILKDWPNKPPKAKIVSHYKRCPGCGRMFNGLKVKCAWCRRKKDRVCELCTEPVRSPWAKYCIEHTPQH